MPSQEDSPPARSVVTRRHLRRATSGFKVPIALKFSVFIALLTLVAMAWVTREAMQVAQESQEIQVNEKGLLALDFLVSSLQPEWLLDDSHRDEIQRVAARALSACADRGVKDLLVLTPQGEVLATGLMARRIEVSVNRHAVEYSPAVQAGVSILEFEYQGEPIRSFEQDILGEGDDGTRPLGRVQVLLSANRIRESRATVRNEMIAISAVTALAVALGSLALATFLTRPIRTLVRDLRQVSLGHLEHKSSVSSRNELGDLARTFNQMTDSLREAQDVLVTQRATEHELNLATQIQQRLLPSATPPVEGFDIAAFYQSAKEVGGDYYDFLRVGQRHVGVVIADVSGKGVPGSLIMTMTRSLLRLATRGSTSPAETVRVVNRTLSPDMNPGMFVTLLYFVLHLPTRSVQLVRAGHNGPLLYSAGARRMVHLNPRGIALGLDPNGVLFDAELETREFSFHSGDVLVAFTDGVTEAKNAIGEDYTQERLARVIGRHTSSSAREIQDAILADLAAHRGDTERSDDITLVVVKSLA